MMLVNRPLAAALLGAAVLTLGACSGKTLGETKIEATFYSPKERVEAFGGGTFDDVSDETLRAAMRPQPKRMVLYDGKDKKSVSWAVDVAEGTASYEASDVGATAPAKVDRAIVGEQTELGEKALGEIPFNKFLDLIQP